MSLVAASGAAEARSRHEVKSPCSGQQMDRPLPPVSLVHLGDTPTSAFVGARSADHREAIRLRRLEGDGCRDLAVVELDRRLAEVRGVPEAVPLDDCDIGVLGSDSLAALLVE